MKHTPTIKEISFELFNTCKKIKFYGFDPYDGINNKILSHPYIPKWGKIFFTQFSKIFFINVRRLLGIAPHQNPKALALFALGAYLQSNNEEYDELMDTLTNNTKGWGYPFPWQSRTFFQKKDEILVVPSYFVACAMLKDAKKYQIHLDFLAEYFSKNLKQKEFSDGSIAFSYGKNDSSCIYNVSALVGDFLCSYGAEFNHVWATNLGIKALQFVINGQNANGSWYYGTDENQKWVDCIHTIYNLQAIEKHSILLQNQKCMENGFQYLMENFVDSRDGSVGNFDKKRYPQETHTIGAFIAYLSQKRDLQRKDKEILENSVNYLIYKFYDKNRKQFFYRKNKYFTNKIFYMRWSNAHA